MSFLEYIGVSLECSVAVLIVMILGAFVKIGIHTGTLRFLWMAIALRLVIPLRVTLLVHGRVETTPLMTPIAEDMPKAALAETLTTVIWLIGGVLFLGFHLTGYFLTCNKIIKKSREAQTALLNSANREALSAAGLKIMWADVPSPMLLGFLRPCLVLPEGVYDDRELNLVVAHEFCHFRSRDSWLKLIFLIANALNWFNPVIYWMMRRADSDLEAACDARVLRRMPGSERRAYARAILRTVDHGRDVLSPHFLSPSKELRRRFVQILHGRPRFWISTPLVLAVIAVLVYSSVSVQARIPTSVSFGIRKIQQTEPADGMVEVNMDHGTAKAESPTKEEIPVLPVDPEETIDIRRPEDEEAPLEILTVTNARVSAPISGEIVRAGYNPHSSGGLEIEIVGEKGRAVLRHLGEIGIEEGDTIEQGAIVGRAGRTGAAIQDMCSFEWRPLIDKRVD